MLLRVVWAEAWSGLPDVVHAAFSVNRHPKAAVIKGMFPTAFEHLDPKLRRYRRLATGESTDLEGEALIRSAVLRAEDTLVVAAANYMLNETLRDGDNLGMNNVVETLSKFAWSTAVRHGRLEPAEARELLVSTYPPAATLDAMAEALEDKALIAEIDQLLVDSVPFTWSSSPKDAESLAALIGRLMSSPALAHADSILDPINLDEGEQAVWEEILRHCELPGVHLAAVGLHLAHAIPIPVPGLHDPAPRPVERQWRDGAPSVMPPPRLLELSLIERLQRPLWVDRRLLVGLDAPGVLRAEVVRVVSPLGLAHPGAHAVFELMRAVALEIGVARTSAVRSEGLAAGPMPTTLLGQSFVGVFHRVDAAKNNTRGYARVSLGALTYLDDPTAGYLHDLWGRAHGHDVRGTLDFTDLDETFRRLVLGVRASLFRRLDRGGGSAQLPDDDLLRADIDGEPDGQVLDRMMPMPTRADALPAFMEALGEIAKVAPEERAALGTFLAIGDSDPVFGEEWDRLRGVARAPAWLTYDVARAVLPMLRIQQDENTTT